MKSLKFSAFVGVLVLGASSQAVVFMDQIGSDPSTISDFSSFSQRNETSFQSFDSVSIDDFTITSGVTLTQVQVALRGFNGFSGPNFTNGAIQNWWVDVYSTPAAAGVSLMGDVAHVQIDPASATVQVGYASTGSFPSALVTFNTNLNIANAGTYYIGVTARVDFNTSGQVGVAATTMSGANPGGLNAIRANPGNGFGEGPTTTIRDDNGAPQNLAYRLSGQPVPEPATMVVLAGGALALLRRRKKA